MRHVDHNPFTTLTGAFDSSEAQKTPKYGTFELQDSASRFLLAFPTSLNPLFSKEQGGFL
jgi:hypothetical protein